MGDDYYHIADVMFRYRQHMREFAEDFAGYQDYKVYGFKQMTKDLYDYVRMKSRHNFQSNSLSKLLIDGYDEEQIWQQIELLNKSALPHFSESLSSLSLESIDLNSIFDDTATNKNEKFVQECIDYAFDDDDDSADGASHFSKEVYAFDDDSDSNPQFPNQLEEKSTSESEIEEKAKSPIKRSHYQKSKVDDQFFKLSQLEDFLKIEDLKAERGDEEIDSDEERIDLFQDIPSDEMEDVDNQDTVEGKLRTKDFMYEDFFDAPESGDESIGENHEIIKNKINVSRDEPMEEKSDSEDDLENQSNQNDIVQAEKVQKTAFELEQEKIKEKIQECEKNMLEPLPWHLTGEVAATNRPIDSLVDKDTEFDCNAKQDLIVDNTLNERIESIIKTAIANKAFCDVERKIKPIEDVVAYKKELVISQKKSKKGLAEVYEEDYLKKQSKKAEEEEDPKHKEIKKLMDELFPELQALFSHIPKPAVPEIKIVSNLPAITVEEVAPTSVSDVTLLAPEEIKKKTGLIKGKTERNITDRKRERRKKKLLQKLKHKKDEAKKSAGETSSKLKKEEKKDILKKLKQHRNTKIADVEADGKIKSSKDFFSKLQDKVHSKSINVKNSNKKWK